MKNFIGEMLKNYKDSIYFVFRVLIGLLFMQHGAQKLFGVLGASGTVQLFSLFGLAGVIEFFGGLAIVLGLLTRLAALGGLFTMVFAYFMVHLPNGWIPIVNGGELASLFFSALLLIVAYGAGKWSLDRAIFGHELF